MAQPRPRYRRQNQNKEERKGDCKNLEAAVGRDAAASRLSDMKGTECEKHCERVAQRPKRDHAVLRQERRILEGRFREGTKANPKRQSKRDLIREHLIERPNKFVIVTFPAPLFQPGKGGAAKEVNHGAENGPSCPGVNQEQWFIHRMHKVVILALEDAVPFDLVIPVEIFSRARTLGGESCYQVAVCGPTRSIKNPLLPLRVRHSSAHLLKADTIVIPGSELPAKPLPKRIREQLVRAYKKGARILSICSGAFHLAETGLLDGRSATTHWLCAAELQAKFPKIHVNPNVLYVDEGRVMTSAGVCAGIDLCLHVVRKDFGAAVATQSARLAVMPLERSGGQAQHIDQKSATQARGSMSPLLEWIEANLAKDLPLERIASQAGMSIRTLNRHFQKQTGTSPLKWILNARVRRARVLLETTQDSMEQIASSVGFGSSITMREHFRSFVHTNPSSYRESFQRRAKTD